MVSYECTKVSLSQVQWVSASSNSHEERSHRSKDTSASIRSSSNLGQLVIPESIIECSDYLHPLLLTS
jgi:hypothetical protein